MASMMSGWPRQWAADKGESPCTLWEALTHWADPADPCAASQRVMQDFVSCQVFPAWTQGGGQVLLGQLEQAVASMSPGITSILELLKEYARHCHPLDEDEEEDKHQHPQQHTHAQRVATTVKAYALLCTFPSRVLLEEEGAGGGGAGAGGGFDCSAFVKGLTYLFNLLLSYRRKAVVAQAGLLVVSQLQVVVDKGNFGGDDNNGNGQQRGRYAMNHRHSVLKDLNELLSNLSVGVRTGLRRQCSTLFTHLPGLLKEAGDYDTQASIVELMYRLTTSTERSHSVTQWFPELECTVHCLFLTISEFDPHCRRFLNAYNSTLGDSRQVFTVPCNAMHIGKLKLCKPKNVSYPRFWIDFNLGTSSILILCQVESTAQPSDPWECLAIGCEEVAGVSLTLRMHSYTLELEYDDFNKVEDLFSSPLNSDSHALLSTVVFFEFPPQPLLERLCVHLFGDKLTVNKLEPKGWRGSVNSSKTVSTSSSSCLGRKYSSAVTGVEPDPSDPHAPFQENGLSDPIPSSQVTQSSTASSRRQRKGSAVAMMCDLDDEMIEQGGGKSSVSKKPSVSSKRSKKSSSVFMELLASDLTEGMERETSGGGASGKHDTSFTIKTRSTRRPRSSRVHRGKGVRSSTTKGMAVPSPRPLQSSLGCYLPLSFTSPKPGAAVPKTRVVSQSPAPTRMTSLGSKHMDQQADVPKAPVTHKAVPSGEINSPTQEGQSLGTIGVVMETEAAAADPKEGEVQRKEKSNAGRRKSSSVCSASQDSEEQKDAAAEVNVIFPSSEESCKVDQDTQITKNSASSDINHVSTRMQPQSQRGKTAAATKEHRPPSPQPASESPLHVDTSRLKSNTKAKAAGKRKPKQRKSKDLKRTREQEHDIALKHQSKVGSQEDLKRTRDQEHESKVGSQEDLKRTTDQEHESKVGSQEDLKRTRDQERDTALTQHKPGSPPSAETNSTGHESNTTKPAAAKHTRKKSNSIATPETHPTPSTTPPPPPPPEEPKLALQQAHDEELFSPDSSPLHESETTQPIEARSSHFSPPRRDPPEASVSRDQGIEGKAKHTPPQEGVLNPQEEGLDSQKEALDPQEALNPQEEELSSQMEALDPQKDALGSQKEVLGPQEKASDPQEALDSQKEALEPQVNESTPQEEMLSLQEAISGPQGRVSSPLEILGSQTEGTALQEEELEDGEVLTCKEKVSEPQEEESALEPHNQDGNTTKASDNAATQSLTNRTSDSLGRGSTRVIQVEKLFVLSSSNEEVVKLKTALTAPTEQSGQLHPDQGKGDTNQLKGKSDVCQPFQEQPPPSPGQGAPARDRPWRRGRRQQGFTPDPGEAVHNPTSYPLLPKPKEVTPLATRQSGGRIRNKRKLFDPTTQEHVKVSPPTEEKTSSQSSQDKQSEGVAAGKKIRRLGRSAAQGDSPAGQEDEATAGRDNQRAGRQRAASNRERSLKAYRSSKGKKRSKCKSPPRRASGFLEDSFLNGEGHTVYSDLECSPPMVVDSWFTERIERAKYSGLPYCNTSTRKSVAQERKRKRGLDSDSDTSGMNYLSVSAGTDRPAKAEAALKPTKKKALEAGTRFEDTSECAMECTDKTVKASPKRKSSRGERPSFHTLLARGTSSSEMSQFSSHDEWLPPSSGKKQGRKEKEDLTVSKRNESNARRQGGRWFKAKSFQDSSELCGANSSSLVESGRVADSLELHTPTTDTLRHTSRSSIDSCTSEFINFKLTASRARTGATEGASPRLQPPAAEPQRSAMELQTSPVEPQTPSPVPQTSKSLVSSPDLQKSPPPLLVMSREPEPSLPPLSAPSPRPQTPALEDLSDQPVREKPCASSRQPQGHSTPRHTSPVSSPNIPSPVLTQSFETPRPAQQTLKATDISSILNPEADTCNPLSGPFQSTLLDSHPGRGKGTSAGPRFSYVSEAESSFINNQEEKTELTVLRDEGMAVRCESPSAVDPVTTVLRYGRDQAGSLTTSSTTVEVHHLSDTPRGTDGDDSDQPAALGSTPVPTSHKTLRNVKQPHQPNTRVSEGEARGRERCCTTMASTTTTTSTPMLSSPPSSLVQPVAPTAMVPPQAVAGAPSRGGGTSGGGGNTTFMGRMYRQFIADLQQTPPSSRMEGSPVRPQARDLFEAARRERESHARRGHFSSLHVEVFTAIMAIISDLQRLSTDHHRLSHSISTLLTKYLEHHGEEAQAV